MPGMSIIAGMVDTGICWDADSSSCCPCETFYELGPWCSCLRRSWHMNCFSRGVLAPGGHGESSRHYIPHRCSCLADGGHGEVVITHLIMVPFGQLSNRPLYPKSDGPRCCGSSSGSNTPAASSPSCCGSRSGGNASIPSRFGATCRLHCRLLY